MQAITATQETAQKFVASMVPEFRILEDDDTIIYHEYGNSWKPIAIYYKWSNVLSYFDKYC